MLIGKSSVNTVAATSDLLQVNGGVYARKLTVTSAGWADHVFAPDYQLPTLAEVKEHIRAHGHLPGIPSAAALERSGVDAADMLRRHMQKIEELTLYAIDAERALRQKDQAIAAAEAAAQSAIERAARVEQRMAALEAKLMALCAAAEVAQTPAGGASASASIAP